MTDREAAGQVKGEKIDRKEIRKFSIGLGIILLGLGGLQVWRGHSSAASVFGTAGLLSLVLAVVAPRLMRPVHLVISKIGHALGWVNTRLILGIMYYSLFTPIALFMKLIGRDPLARRFDPEATTYWVEKPEEKRGVERYEKMY